MRVSHALEIAFSRATREAARRRHDRVDAEHLLHALLADQETAHVVAHAGGDVAALQRKLEELLDEVASRTEASEPVLSPAFQRAVGRAAMHVQSAGKQDLRGPDILIALLDEHACPAVSMLVEHGITSINVVDNVSRGVSRTAARGRVEAAFSLATREAARRRHELVDVEHLLYALLFDEEATEPLRQTGGDIPALKTKLDRFLASEIAPSPAGADTSPTFSPRCQRVVDRQEDLTSRTLLMALLAETYCASIR